MFEEQRAALSCNGHVFKNPDGRKFQEDLHLGQVQGACSHNTIPDIRLAKSVSMESQTWHGRRHMGAHGKHMSSQRVVWPTPRRLRIRERCCLAWPCTNEKLWTATGLLLKNSGLTLDANLVVRVVVPVAKCCDCWKSVKKKSVFIQKSHQIKCVLKSKRKTEITRTLKKQLVGEEEMILPVV